MSDKIERKRFGKYLILDHLIDGGMAKICRARFLGEQAAKVVAIKMVQPQFSKDPSFKTMFMDEIKLTFGLIHPNIVQTYDYGLYEEQLYVAMEYCDGRNLKEYLDKLKQRKFVFPVEISVYITTQICQGLHYAHTYTDKLTGKKANIIHRDISPHNIMLTYDGAVKIIDFGIAKSETNSEATQAGTIKGKLSYLAPEYLEGMDLDPRYDEFAVGITLWELLCSRKLFKANNDLAVLKKIQECKIPTPSSINPNVPAELDDIVMKCLSKDRNKRFEDMEKMNRALIKFLYSNYPDFNASDLSYFAKELFKEEIRQDREKLFEFGKIDVTQFLEDMDREAKGGTEDRTIQTQVTSNTEVDNQESVARNADGGREENILDFGLEDDDLNLSLKEEKVAPKTRTNIKAKALLNMELAEEVKEETEKQAKQKVTEIVKKRNKTIQTRRPSRSGTRTSRNGTRAGGNNTSLDTAKKSRLSRIGGKEPVVKKSNSDMKTKLLGGVATVALCFAGYMYMKGGSSGPRSSDRVPTSVKKQVNKKQQNTNQTTVILKNLKKGEHTVFVNGNKTNFDHLGNISIPKNEKFWLRVQKRKHEHFVRKIDPTVDGRVIEIPETAPSLFGFLTTSYECMQGKIYFQLFGERRSELVPIESKYGIPLPVASRQNPNVYKMIFIGKTNKKKIKKRISFEVGADQAVDLCKYLDQ